MSFHIIRLKTKDERRFAEVIAIQKAHDITGDLLKNHQKEAEKGFLLFPSTVDDIEEHIAEGRHLDLALAADGSCVGFCLSYPAELLYENPKITWLNENYQKKYLDHLEEGDFTYIDQIAVAPGWQGQGVADALLARVEQDTDSFVACAIVQEPVNNVRSLKFFQRQGFVVVGTSTTEHWENLDRVTSALLVKDMS